MTHVITQSCCNDAACTAVCPVDCIQPAPGTPGFATAEMLHIDPATCIDCGSCVPECPVDAIVPDVDLPPALEGFRGLNAAWFEAGELGAVPARSVLPPALSLPRRLRVAVVGAGPAGMYAALDLLGTAGSGAEVDVYDRLPTPWGLVRYGVAPDHPATKRVAESFAEHARNPDLRFRFGVEVGTHVTHDELARAYDAVVYAVGAAGSRALGIPGEDLPGSVAAADLVAWYNGHPDAGDLAVEVSGPRAVVIGNGNVALDVARILVGDPASLRPTDMSGHALAALERGGIRHVTVLGRRGPLQAACTTAELLGLARVPGVHVATRPEELVLTPAEERSLAADPILRAKYAELRRFASAPDTAGDRRIELRFLARPVEIAGRDGVTAVRVRRLAKREVGDAVTFEPTGATEELAASLVVRSVGYRTPPLPGVPYDPYRAVVRNEEGRVVDDDGRPVPGCYVVGWAKRGPGGVIGTNKHCSAATMAHLRADADAGLLPAPATSRRDLDDLLAARCTDLADWDGWRRLDRHELAAGREQGRHRLKVTSLPEMWRVAAGHR